MRLQEKLVKAIEAGFNSTLSKSKWQVYLLGVWLDHDVTIDENGTNDGKREEWMGEDMYGDPSDRMERRQEE